MLLLTAAEMRRLDRATIDGGHAAGAALMERAGAGVVLAMHKRYGSPLAMRILVVCGTGNNGGDGFVAARYLAMHGAEVHVVVAGDLARIQGDALAHLQRLRAEGVEVASIASEADLQELVATRDQWDFAVDALLGTGASGAPTGPVADAVQVLRELDETGTRVIAVDLPTGVDADTGAIARRAVRADLTVSFGAPKRGHFLYPARAFVGALEVVDIGLSLDAVGAGGFPVTLATAPEMAALIPARDPRAHKGVVGRIVIVGGSVGLTGAVALAARAASRAGAGYVEAAVPDSLNPILEAKLTEQITRPMAETPSQALAAAALQPILGLLERCDVLAIGPGLSRESESADLARSLIAGSPRPLVIDADALNALIGHDKLLSDAGSPRILTPHLGEMSRLTGVSAADLEARRIDAAREWAQRWHSVVVLKGAPTVVASPAGAVTVNPTGNPGMAALGMGDVLTGVIAALLGQGLSPYDAARLGAYVHGMAGDIVEGEKGQHGLTAGDVVEAVPLALLGLARLRLESLAGAANA
jgi:NAD(P)H-hydrate epimerase